MNVLLPLRFPKPNMNRIPPEYAKATMNVLPEEIKLAVQRMARKEPNDNGELSIALIGPVGSGKTFLAWAIADYFVQTQEFGKFPVFYTESELLDRLRHSAHASLKTPSWDDTFFPQTKKSTELLVVDDFGTAKQSEFSLQLLTDLLEYRISWHLPTVITSNIRFDDVKSVQGAVDVYGERIVSRIAGRFQQFVIDGKDRRKG